MYYYLRRGKLSEILEKAERVFVYSSRAGLEEIDMREPIRKCKMLIWSWTILLCVVGQMMALWPVMAKGRDNRTLGLPLWYPYDWHRSPAYEMTLIIQSAMQFLMPMSYAGVDTFFPCISILLVGQFRILGRYLYYGSLN